MNRLSKRFLATLTEPQYNVFNRSSKLKHRSFPARTNPELSRSKDYLRDDVALKTIERLAFITRPLDKVLDFGSNNGNFLKQLCVSDPSDEQLNKDKKAIRSKINQLIMFDSSKHMLYRDINQDYHKSFPGEITRIVGDEESFTHEIFQKPDQFDAVISNLSLHWINNLPQTLANINRILKPDGFFMGTLFGGDTLYELRTSLQLAELERKGGMSPRLSPLVRINDVGNLLNRAGFTMLTIDAQDIIVGGFPDIVTLCNDLQLMGEQNSLVSAEGGLSRDVLLAANEIYKSLHGEVHEGEMGLPATFNVIFMIGWKKSQDQAKPLERGTGQVNLKDVL
ncbi:NADH dehydrogenase ubiquinone 1 alpha subcomplex assembly factor 5 [Spathaspora sp. JA1]|nr:NADH dehydrogenase ubiquinone 1 alpha subcomplex assembly factor 5 [Spathaspora sp. JA1]